jgi:GNAT superfamily N-acetyltransferase
MSHQSSVTISPAEAADLSAMMKLSEQLGYPLDPGDLLRRFRELALNPDHQVLVAKIKSQVVGFQHLRVIHDLIEEHGVEMAVLVVDDAFRGQGVGAALVRAAEKWTQNLNFKILFLRSNIKRDRAHHFYLREGFAEDSTSKAFIKKLV